MSNDKGKQPFNEGSSPPKTPSPGEGKKGFDPPKIKPPKPNKPKDDGAKK